MSKHMTIISLSILTCFIVCTSAAIQEKQPTEAGIPFITNYQPSEYQAHGQNWAIIQDNDGLMYFGNTDGGILQYDGVSWRHIPVTNGSIVRSLAMDSKGTIYAGAQNEIGYLSQDSTGSLRYVSILSTIPEAFREFGDVWQIHFIEDQLHFSTRKFLFRRNKDGSYKIWQAENVFHASFNPGQGKLYIHQRKTGLMILDDDSLKRIPGGERFKDDWVYVIITFNDNKVLIASRNSGLFTYDGQKIIKFWTPAEKWLINNHVYHGTHLNNGQIALGTLRNGLLVLDSNGEISNLVNKTSGLIDDQIWHVYQDAGNNLWLALNKGIAHIEIPSPWSSYSEANGLEGNVHDIIRHNSTLYVATGMGVYELITSGRDNPKNRFVLLDGLKSQCWALLSIHDRLLVSCNHGIFEYRKNQFRQISSKSAWQFLISGTNPSRIYMGLDQGVSSIYWNQNRWIEEDRLPDFMANARTLAEDEKGRLWVGTVYEGLYQIEFEDKSNQIKDIKNFKETDGLPGPNYNLVFSAKEKLLYGTSKGIYVFREDKQKFEPLPVSNTYPQQDALYSIVSSDFDGNIWFNSGQNLVRLTKNANKQLEAVFKPYQRLQDFKIYNIYPESDGVIWLGGPEGIMRFDPGIRADSQQVFLTYVRRVKSFGDSMIYNGAREKSPPLPLLPYSHEAMRFEFAAPFYTREDLTTYRFYLNGFDSDWSEWTGETRKDYTNIPEGDYSFNVQAKNIFGEISSTASYRFEILAPLYRRWWAYLIYVLIIYFLVHLSISKLIAHTKKKAVLEQQQLEETRRIIETDLRSQVAADFHDELGTQITRISLFSEILKNDLVDISDTAKTYLQKISNNAEDLYCETRDFIWQLDPKSDSLKDFTSRIKSFANDLLDGTDIHFEISEEPDNSADIKLPMDMRRNLIRIFKEGLHNAFKHAGCSNIIFIEKVHDHQLEISLADDGNGFKTMENSDGNGLLNMQSRADKIKGVLQIDSAPGSGTKIKITVDL